MWALLALLATTLMTGVKSRSLVIDINSCDYEFNRDIVQNITLTLITVNNRKVINGSLIAQIDVPAFDLTTTITLPKGKNRKTLYYNLTLDGCEFIAQSLANPISLSGFVANNIRKAIKNVPKRCPIKKSTEVLVENLYVDTELMPAYLPETRFDFSITLTIKTTMGFKIFASGVVAPKRIRKG